MPNFFQRCVNIKSACSINGSDTHLNSQRANGITQILSSTVQSVAPSVVIPTKFAQVIISLWASTIGDSYIPEKILHALQGLIAAAQLGLAITILFESQSCSTTDAAICKAVLLLEFLYTATLLSTWAPAEIGGSQSTPALGPNVPNAVPLQAVGANPAINEDEEAMDPIPAV